MPPVFVAAFEIAGVTATFEIGATSVSLASVLGNLAFTASLVGAQYLLAGSQKQRSQPLQTTLRDAVVARFHVFGRALTGGATMFKESSGSGFTYGFGLVLNCGPVDAVEILYRDDAAQDVTGVSGDVTTWGDPRGRVGWIEAVNASEAGYHSAVIAASDLSAIWDGTHLAKGLTCVYAAFPPVKQKDRQFEYPNYFPTIRAVLRGEGLFDPRDHAQNADDSATWAWSDNSILCASTFAIHPGGLGLAPSWLNWPVIADAAQKCDAIVPGYGGRLAPWARCWDTWTEADEPRNVLGRDLSTCDGIYYEDSDGQFCLRVAEYIEPKVWFTDADISVAIDDPEQAGLQRTTLFRPKYQAAAHNYQMVDAAEARAPDDKIALYGEIAEDLQIAQCPDPDQAYRLARRTMKRLLAAKLQLTVGPYGIAAVGQPTVGVDSEALGYRGVYEVLNCAPADLSTWTFSLRATSPEMFVDDIAPAPSEFAIPQLIATTPDAPVFVSLSEVTLGAARLVRLVVDSPATTSWTLDAQVRESTGPGDWYDMTPIAQTVAQSPPLAAGSYEVHFAWINGGGQRSGYPASHTISIGGLAAPANPASFLYTGSDLYAVAPNDANFDGVRIYHTSAGVGWATRALLTTLYGAPNSGLSYPVATGSGDYYATSVNIAGTESAGHLGPVTP